MNIFVKIYKDLAKIPDFKSGIITKVVQESKTTVSVQATWTIRNVPAKQRLSHSVNYLIEDSSVQRTLPSMKNQTVILSAVDSSGTLTAEILQDDNMKQLVIYDESDSVTCLDLKELNLHGTIYSDSTLSSLCWSNSSSHLAFVAEKKRPKPSSFFSEDNKEEKDGMGKEYCFYDDWGEQMEGMHQSTIVIVDLKSSEVKTLDFPEGLCGGMVQWAPDDSGLVGVAFLTDPYRLGMIYCLNRQSVIFHMDNTGHLSELTDRDHNFGQIRFSPDGKKMVFLSSKVGGTHIGSAKLCIMDWESKKVRVVVDDVLREKKIENDEVFRGLNGYSNLARRCWSKDNVHLFFSTLNQNINVSYLLNTDSGSIKEVPFIHGRSLVVVDVKEDWILFRSSTMINPTQIFLGKFSLDQAMTHIPLSPTINIDEFKDIKQEEWTFINSVPHPVEKYSNLPIPVIFVGKTSLNEEKKRPLIVWAHGGPHSAIPKEYSFMVAFFVRIGYSIVFPNFRGSLGQGKDSIESLPGHCGTTDLLDVHQCTLETLKRYSSVLDETKVFLNGGSHGGFLVTSLAGAYPDFYKVICARNPVVDIGVMSRISDILDWSLVESGVDFSFSKICSGEELTKMQTLSPINAIDNIKAPIAFFLGSKDRRVPYSQGLYFYRMLLARSVKTRAFIYEDNHSLAKVPVEADNLIQMALWYQEHGLNE